MRAREAGKRKLCRNRAMLDRPVAPKGRHRRPFDAGCETNKSDKCIKIVFWFGQIAPARVFDGSWVVGVGVGWDGENFNRKETKDSA